MACDRHLLIAVSTDGLERFVSRPAVSTYAWQPSKTLNPVHVQGEADGLPVKVQLEFRVNQWHRQQTY